MKTYQQVLNEALLIGAIRYFNGDSIYGGAHEFVTAVTFIYDVPREKFLNDYQELWNEVNEGFADDVIARIKSLS